MSKQLTLGITTIGDLLLNNRITMTDNEKFPETITLNVPDYQRPYKWTAKNVNQLLDDIEEAMNSNKEIYRVGTLILHHDKDVYNIVDGQQRTISFAILLHCLVQKQISFLDQKISDNEYSRHNVLYNYRSFERRILRFLPDEKDRKKLADYIINQCQMIVVITEDLSEAFQFFDSQNARGKALYPHDLLKAYHLREMSGIDIPETERVVRIWEEMNQKELADLFNEYLYRLKEWVRGNKAEELSERNIEMFKGITVRDNLPYAQYYKGAYAYAEEKNRSNVPFVTGIQPLNPFQLNAPIIAGKPFFDYARHYFEILSDIRNNDKFEGYFIKDNPIVRTLDLSHYRNGTGNRITRLLFDTAILLYVDRFCPGIPSKEDTEYLEQFVVFAFIWAYSMRARYRNVGWRVAQNYVMGTADLPGLVNSFNIYKVITESDTPSLLLSWLADKLRPLKTVAQDADKGTEQDDELRNKRTEKKVQGTAEYTYQNYLSHFKDYQYWGNK